MRSNVLSVYENKDDLFLPLDSTAANDRNYWADYEEISQSSTNSSSIPRIRTLSETATKSNQELENIGPAPILIIRRETLRDKPFVSMQKWEGVVDEIDEQEEVFRARLYDIYNQDVEEIAEIPLEEVLPDDRLLLKPGAVFYWNIGYLDPFGTRKRVSIVVFRRLPKPSASFVKKALAQSEHISETLDWR